MGAGNPKEGFGTAFSSLVNRMEAFVQPIEFVDRMEARTACRILSIRRKAFRQQPIEYCLFERKAFGQPFRRILDRRKARTAYRFLSIERRLFGTVFSSIDKGIQGGGSGYFFVYCPTRISLRNLDLIVNRCWFRMLLPPLLAESCKPCNTGNKHNKQGLTRLHPLIVA